MSTKGTQPVYKDKPRTKTYVILIVFVPQTTLSILQRFPNEKPQPAKPNQRLPSN